MTPSDWIEIFGILASLITSIIAIIISVKTLQQNNKMIEESTRPYIVVCGKVINCQDPTFYLVLKNYGSSGATITSFKCNCDLSKYSYSKSHIPFEHIAGTFVAPNQSFVTALLKNELFKNDLELKFDITYKNSDKEYSDSFNINLSSYTDLIQPKAATDNKELKIISYALQDLVEKQL